MTELIDRLYYMVEDVVGQQELEDGTARALTVQWEALRDEVVLRLGEGGRELMEALSDLGLKRETIHDQMLFRTALGLGAEIAHPAGFHL